MVAPLVVWMRHDAMLLMLLPAMAAKRTGNIVGAYEEMWCELDLFDENGDECRIGGN